MMGRLSSFMAVGLVLLLAFALAGCSGGNSSSEEQAQVNAVTVTDNGSVAKMKVAFSLYDDGSPLAGVEANNIRFSVAKLIPASSPSRWQSYINVVETKEAGDPGNAPDGTPTPDGTEATHATAERASTDGGVFTDNGDGTYSYEISINFRDAADPVTDDPITYDPSLTHRIAMQVSDNATNAIYDFIPNNQNATPDTRSIVSNVTCSECHEKFGFHGGDRVAVEYCVTCHNPGSTDANSGNTVDFTVMIHKIHAGEDGPDVTAGGEYAIWGFRNTKHDYSEVVFPQDTQNCTKCHDGSDPETPDGDNWKNVPSEAACASCHEAPPNVEDLTPAEIETAHLTPNATPNNPGLPTGVPNIEYELIEATVNGSNQAVITFRILQDGAALDLFDRDANLPAGSSFDSRWPAFLLAYAQPQDGITAPAEYNNLGEDSAQPITVDMDELDPISSPGPAGTLVDNLDGTYTATTTVAFPAGATLRAVGLQGYFRVNVDDGAGGTVLYSLHTPSAVIAVNGDDERREVVDNNKCASCHEWFEGHGGNRTFNMNICVMCHVPNLSSSGRGIETPNAANLAAYGADPLLYPEATNNFKDMVHGIHGSAIRTTDYEFVRGGSRQNPYNFSDVVFPGRTADCLTCHKTGTYALPLVDDTLMTTDRTTGATDGNDLDRDAVLSARSGASLPNNQDFVITPTAAACFSCHDDTVATAHMEQNGAIILENRSVVLAGSAETCSLCHAPGKTADIEVVHAAEEYTLIGTITAPDDSSGDLSQVELCAPGPLSARPAGHTSSLDCCSCHGFN